MEDYAELNRASWDERAPAHAASRDYAVDRFTSDVVAGRDSIDELITVNRAIIEGLQDSY